MTVNYIKLLSHFLSAFEIAFAQFLRHRQSYPSSKPNVPFSATLCGI